MPRKPKIEEVVTPVEEKEEVVAVIESKPQKHTAIMYQKQQFPNVPVLVDIRVADLVYWDSTDELEFFPSEGWSSYFSNFVNSGVQLGTEYIPPTNRKAWIEALPTATLVDNIFCGVLLSTDETE